MKAAELSLKAVTKFYGDKQVLEPITLSVRPGAFVALLGPSGCGKTTLLRIIAGLESPSAGEVYLGDRLLNSDQVNVPPEKRGFGMVFQSYAVWPHMNVFENVAYPLALRRNPKWNQAQIQLQVDKVLNLVGLEGFRERMPSQLSGGQQQRVALARGLVMEPAVLLLDEPLSNLDAKLRAKMRREIRELHRSLGITLLYVTHDQREAFEMSTEVVVMSEGKVVQRGTPDEVRSSPEPTFVREFLQEG